MRDISGGGLVSRNGGRGGRMSDMRGGGEGRVRIWGWGGVRWSCVGQCGLARCGPNLSFGYLCVYLGLGRDVMEFWWEM